jgi:hypothetical protein
LSFRYFAPSKTLSYLYSNLLTCFEGLKDGEPKIFQIDLETMTSSQISHHLKPTDRSKFREFRRLAIFTGNTAIFVGDSEETGSSYTCVKTLTLINPF